ncbi:hypothetical protein [Streptococcus suis]|uniref:hypothetical protein n=1 Tax=Streptococcus suis TaxID=1307 RepID=UPI000CF375EB|nr:hypothetical protein [Streptococcus suis]
MTEKLGVLLVDVPEPKTYKYTFLTKYYEGTFEIDEAVSAVFVVDSAYKCTQEEAKKYPQFRWVALDDLS